MNIAKALKLLVLGASILVVDFIIKGAVNFHFQPMEHAPHIFPFGGIEVFKNILGIDFCIHHVTNRGAAWGVGSQLQNLLLFARIAVVIGLAVYLWRSPKSEKHSYPLILVMAGGLGNILDYFIYGHVVDMFHFYFWGYSYPVFNVADASIFCGIVWLLCQSWFKRHHAAA